MFWYNTQGIKAQNEVRHGILGCEKISVDIHSSDSFKELNTGDLKKTFYKKKKRKKGRAIEELFSSIAFQPVFKAGFFFHDITISYFSCNYSSPFSSVKKRGPPNA